MSSVDIQAWSTASADGDDLEFDLQVQMLMNLATAYGWEPNSSREQIGRFLRASLDLEVMRAEVLWQHRKVAADITLLGKALGKSFSDFPNAEYRALADSAFEYFSRGFGDEMVQSWIDALRNGGVNPTTNRSIEGAEEV